MKRIKIYPLRFMHRTGDNRTFHQCIHRIHGGQHPEFAKLINIRPPVRNNTVSDDSKPEILQLLNSCKKNTLQLDQRLLFSVSKMTKMATPTMFKCGSYLQAHLTFMMRTLRRICSPCWSSVAAPGITCRRSAQPLIFYWITRHHYSPASINIFRLSLW